jgi:hypothetical protein
MMKIGRSTATAHCPDLLLERVDGSDSSKDSVAVVGTAAAVQLLKDGKAQEAGWIWKRWQR